MVLNFLKKSNNHLLPKPPVVWGCWSNMNPWFLDSDFLFKKTTTHSSLVLNYSEKLETIDNLQYQIPTPHW
jgi:hypothetical protein